MYIKKLNAILQMKMPRLTRKRHEDPNQGSYGKARTSRGGSNVECRGGCFIIFTTKWRFVFAGNLWINIFVEARGRRIRCRLWRSPTGVPTTHKYLTFIAGLQGLRPRGMNLPTKGSDELFLHATPAYLYVPLVAVIHRFKTLSGSKPLKVNTAVTQIALSIYY